MERLCFSRSKRSQRAAGAIVLCQDIVRQWLDEAVARAEQCGCLGAAPLVVGPSYLFAGAPRLPDFEKRLLLARDKRWTELAVTVRVQLAAAASARARKPRTDRASRLTRQADMRMSEGLVQKAIRATRLIDAGPVEAADVPSSIRRLFVVSEADPIQVEAEGPMFDPTKPSELTPKSAVRRALEASSRSSTRPRAWEDLVLEAVRRLGKGSAAGPCGLRRDILLPLLDCRSLLKSYARLVDLALAGRIHDPYLIGSSLELIPKKAGGARPLGMGSILRRVCGKLAARAAVAGIRAVTEPQLQFALSEAGTMRLFHKVRAAAAHGQLIVSMDIENAFNTIDRDFVMAVIERHAGPARAFAEVCYGVPSPIHARLPTWPGPSHDGPPPDDMSLEAGLDGRMHVGFHTNRGVIQGCPMAPLLFAAAMAELTAECRGASDEVTICSFQDDVFLIGTDGNELLKSFEAVATALVARGMSLSASKCHTLAPSPNWTSNVCSDLLAKASQVPTLKCMGGPIVGKADPDGPKRLSDEWDAVARGVSDAVHSLRHLTNPQHVVRALQQAGGWSRIQYFASLGGGLEDGHLRTIEEADCLMLTRALGALGPLMTPMHWQRATLPTSRGGLGIKSTTFEAHLRRPAYELYLESLDSVAGAAAQRNAPDKSAELGYQDAADVLLDVLPAERVSRFAELNGPYATEWLTGPLNRWDGTLIPSPQVASGCLAMAAGVPLLSREMECRGASGRGCRKEGDPTGASAVLDRFGEHAHRCPGAASRRHLKATACFESTWAQGKNVESNFRREVGVDVRGNPTTGQRASRPGDVAYRANASDRWTFIDYTTGSQPVGASRRGDVDPLAGARLARQRKRRQQHHQSIARRDDLEAVMITQGTMGGLDRQSFAALERFVKASGNVRHDGHQPASVLAQRLQLACVSEAVELVVEAGGLDAAVLRDRVIKPLSRPCVPLVPHDRVVEASHEVLIRGHTNDALRLRWRGDVERYTGDLENVAPHVYSGRRCGRERQRGLAARAVVRPAAGCLQPRRDDGVTARLRQETTASVSAVGSPPPSLPSRDDVSLLDSYSIGHPCDQIQHDAWTVEHVDESDDGVARDHPDGAPSVSDADSLHSSAATDWPPARAAARGGGRQHQSSPHPRPRDGRGLGADDGVAAIGASAAVLADAASTGSDRDPPAARHLTPASPGRRRMSNGARTGNLGVMLCALVWDCISWLHVNRPLRRTDFSDGAAWTVLQACRRVMRETMEDGTASTASPSDAWGIAVTQYCHSVEGTLAARLAGAGGGPGATTFTVDWMWRNAVGRIIRSAASRDLLMLRTVGGGALADEVVRRRLAEGFGESAVVRSAWRRLSVCEVGRARR